MELLLIGVGIGILVAALLFYLWYNRDREVSRLAELDNFKYQAREILREAVESTEAQNAILLHIHNSGSVMGLSTVMYSSIITEVPEDEQMSAYNDWQRMPVDHEYRQLIDSLTKNKKRVMYTESMAEGLLKRTYIAKGINASLVFEVYDKTNNSYFYASYPCRIDAHKMISEQLVQFEYNVVKLNALCHRYHKRKILL